MSCCFGDRPSGTLRPWLYLYYAFDNLSSAYRHRSLYIMRTDLRNRCGTPLEKRVTGCKAHRMMEDVALKGIRFAEHPPYWCAIGFRK